MGDFSNLVPLRNGPLADESRNITRSALRPFRVETSELPFALPEAKEFPAA